MSSLITETENQMLCGGWNEAGLVESLDRKGFTLIKGLLELFANSSDAKTRKIITEISSVIKIIDDGRGMDRNKLKDMFDMFKSNNSGNKSMGVSGLGGKEGMYIGSKKSNKEPTTVFVFTHKEGDEYLKATIPWKKIFDDKIYTGRIVINEMTAEEISNFQAEREECQFRHGTTIQFEFNDELKNLIETQFDIKRLCQLKIPREDRCDFVFGQKNVEIILKKIDGTSNLSIEKYDYFSGNDTEYYAGKSCDIIEQWKSPEGEDKYACVDENGQRLCIIQTAKTCSTSPAPMIMNGTGWEIQGAYIVKNGIRCCKEIFDPANPIDPYDNVGAAMYLNPYDKKYFEKADVEYIKDCFSGCAVVRNSQFITNIPYSDKTFNAKTSRGGFTSMFNNIYHRTEINYETESKQDNRMDKAMGIQENKNQHQKVLPLTLERLIIYLKKQHIEKVNNYFKNVIKTKADHDKKKRELEAERRRIENEQRQLAEQEKRIKEEAARRLAEQEKRVKEEAARRLAELSKPKPVVPPSPPDNIVLKRRELSEDSGDESGDESDSDASDHNSVDSKELLEYSDSDSELTDVENTVIHPTDVSIIQPDNLDELKRKFIEKFTVEQDYEKVKKLFEMYNTL
jgi:hypothetical protein